MSDYPYQKKSYDLSRQYLPWTAREDALLRKKSEGRSGTPSVREAFRWSTEVAVILKRWPYEISDRLKYLRTLDRILPRLG